MVAPDPSEGTAEAVPAEKPGGWPVKRPAGLQSADPRSLFTPKPDAPDLSPDDSQYLRTWTRSHRWPLPEPYTGQSHDHGNPVG